MSFSFHHFISTFLWIYSERQINPVHQQLNSFRDELNRVLGKANPQKEVTLLIFV